MVVVLLLFILLLDLGNRLVRCGTEDSLPDDKGNCQNPQDHKDRVPESRKRYPHASLLKQVNEDIADHGDDAEADECILLDHILHRLPDCSAEDEEEDHAAEDERHRVPQSLTGPTL